MKKFNFMKKAFYLSFMLFIPGIIGLALMKTKKSIPAKGNVISAEEIMLYSPLNGAINLKNIQCGESVKKGTALFVYRTPELNLKISEAKRSILVLKAELKLAEANYKLLSLDPLPKEYRYAEQEELIAHAKLSKSKGRFEKFKILFQRKSISITQVESSKSDFLQDKANLKKAESKIKKIHNGLASLILNHEEQKLLLKKTLILNKQKYLSFLQNKKENYIIRAPHDGVVVELPKHSGIYFKKGEIAAKMIKGQNKIIETYVEQRFIKDVQEGQNARITSKIFNIIDYKILNGKVLEMSMLPITKGKSVFYNVKILVEDPVEELKLGSQADVEIIAGEETVLEMVLR